MDGVDAYPVVTALAERELSTGLCIPLTHGGSPLGTVNLIFRDHREIRPLEVETFHGIARAVSLALANARLVADLEHLVELQMCVGYDNGGSACSKPGQTLRILARDSGGRPKENDGDLRWFLRTLK